MQPKAAAKNVKAGIDKALKSANESAIRADIENIKSDVSSLARNVKAEGETIASNLREEASVKYDELRDQGADLMRHVERHVNEKPAQSLMMAFGAGVLLSFLLRR